MKKYKIEIDIGAFQDIQENTDWYNEQSRGLGSRFQRKLKLQINSLKTHPDRYSIRYADVRCMAIKNFPFLVHYIVDNLNLIVEVFASYIQAETLIFGAKK